MSPPTSRPWSMSWVVVTHVLNSLFYTAGLAGLVTLVGGALFTPPVLSPLRGLLAVGWAALAAWGATEYSILYIRERAQPVNPQACILPSVIAFAGLVAGLLALPLLVSRGIPRGIERLFLIGYFIAPVIVFSLFTWRGFRAMPRPDVHGFEIRPVLRVEPWADQAE